MKTLSAPLSICLAITNKCNLSCKHCLAASSQKNQDLTTEELFSIIRQIKELKIFDVSIFGGEPLLREDFFEVLEAFSVSKIVVGLNTNGTLITKDTARRLSGSSIRGYTVSLDGSKESVQDPFRGEGSFKKNIEGIRNLADIGANITISTIITKYNFN